MNRKIKPLKILRLLRAHDSFKTTTSTFWPLSSSALRAPWGLQTPPLRGNRAGGM